MCNQQSQSINKISKEMGSDSAKQSFILSSPILQALVCPALPGMSLGVLFPSAKPILETKKICFVFLNDDFQSRQINPSDFWNPTPLGCAITHMAVWMTGITVKN